MKITEITLYTVYYIPSNLLKQQRNNQKTKATLLFGFVIGSLLCSSHTHVLQAGTNDW